MPAQKLRPTVYIVDDDPGVRDSLAAFLSTNDLRADTYASAEAFLDTFSPDHSGCLIVDLKMTGMSGLDLQDTLVARGVRIPVLILTGYADVPTAVQAMEAGAMTFLEKSCSQEELLAKVHQALEQDAIARQRQAEEAAIRSRLEQLTQSEWQVLDRLLAGMPNKIIARELDMGLRTVELRRSEIMKKMGVRSLAEVVRLAVLVRGRSQPG